MMNFLLLLLLLEVPGGKWVVLGALVLVAWACVYLMTNAQQIFG